ncbi:hypothetical protein Tco_0922285 [Tanacetum coccineum]|uniref:Uncharacterized protein n=1 Tax=Tanacetum coccineum TaxID=301880 RepID=A0ABQ5CXP5_9ASTR
MGDENPIRTLGDYYKPSHEGYRNTIGLPVGNNVVPLRSDTIQFVANGCSLSTTFGLEYPTNTSRIFLTTYPYTTWEDLLHIPYSNSFHLGRAVKLSNDILMSAQQVLTSSTLTLISRTTRGLYLFQINEPIFRELVREFFASFEFDATPCRYKPLHKGVTFRLGGVEREMSLLKFGWRVGLYSEGESRDVATLSGLRNAETVNATRLTHSFWPIIGDKPEGDKRSDENGKMKDLRIANIYRAIVSQGIAITRPADGSTRFGWIDAWMGNKRTTHWINNHTVRSSSTERRRDNLEPTSLIESISWVRATTLFMLSGTHAIPSTTLPSLPSP